MRKQTRRIASLLLVLTMMANILAPTTVVYAATKSPVTKVTTQDIRNKDKFGNSCTLHLWGCYYYRTTATLAKSSKKTKIKLKYSHQIRPLKSGTFKLTVGKKTVTVCKIYSYPYKTVNNKVLGHTTNLYLESVEIKTGNKWKKVKVTNDGVEAEGVRSEMKTFTLKKIPKGTKIRFTFNACVGTPRTSSGK